MKTLFVFDLDGTLAESKSSLDAEMSKLLTNLVVLVKVAVISGGSWEQFEKQLLSNLPRDSRLRNLFLLPTCGTKFFQYSEADWVKMYSEDLTGEEKEAIIKSLNHALEISGFKPGTAWGELIEDRGSQITFSALGQGAPLEEKIKGGSDLNKRKHIIANLEPILPGFSIRIGGATSIDITKPGIDKAYGIRKLRDILSIQIQDMLFVGDALFPGGNDFPVKETGITSIQVRDPNETKLVIETALGCLG
jgi:phosphomannomutase